MRITGQAQRVTAPRWRGQPFIWLLALAFICVFFFTNSADGAHAQAVFHRFGVIPAILFGNAHAPASLAAIPAPLTLATASFVHVDAAHLIANVAFLIVFGRLCRGRVAGAGLLLLFLLCGAAGFVAEAALDPAARTPIVGASAAVSGLLGAALRFRAQGAPFGGRWTDFGGGALAAVWIAAPILLDAGGAAAEVPHAAHIGGLAAGAALAPLFARRGETHSNKD